MMTQISSLCRPTASRFYKLLNKQWEILSVIRAGQCKTNIKVKVDRKGL